MSLLQGIVNKNHILLLGIPRTGSTWLGKILTQTWDYSYVHEPDNERHTFFAYYGKQNMPRFPLLTALDENKRYLEMFQTAFHQPYITYDSTSNQLLKKITKLSPQAVEAHLQEFGKNPNHKLQWPYILGHALPKQLGNRNNRVVKSVHAILAAQFLFQHFSEATPLFLLRHPAAVVASMLRMGNEDIDRKLYEQPAIQARYPILKSFYIHKESIEWKAGLQVAIFYKEIERLLGLNENAQLITFEELANDPFHTSHDLYEKLNMKWTDDVELFIANSNRKGTGYETRRETKRQASKWKNELTKEQISEIEKGYSSIGEISFYQEF